MELRTMRYFLAVAREENMTRAAEFLHVTQPTLSKSLKSLEDELGKKLFVRHSFHIELTEEGVLLRKRAQDLVSMADKIQAEFLTLNDILGGEVYFGLAESYQIRYLAAEIKSFKNSYPGLRYHITSGDTEQVTEKLDNGVIDFAVLAEQPNTIKYNYMTFTKEGFTVTQKDQSMDVAWDQIRRVVGIRGEYILYMGQMRAYLIPDRILGQDKEKFAGFLREVLPGERLKRV